MNVQVEIELSTSPTEKDKEQVLLAAASLTNDSDSIIIYQSPENTLVLIAEFTMEKGRPIDLVDKIGREFSNTVENYNDSAISFPRR